MWRYKVIISGDFNAKSKAWGGTKTDRRGRMQSEVLDRNHLASIRIGKGSTFQRGNRRSFLDIMSVSGSLFKMHKRSVILEDCSASDHSYVLHGFKGLVMPRNRGRLRYSTTDIARETFI